MKLILTLNQQQYEFDIFDLSDLKGIVKTHFLCPKEVFDQTIGNPKILKSLVSHPCHLLLAIEIFPQFKEQIFQLTMGNPKNFPTLIHFVAYDTLEKIVETYPDHRAEIFKIIIDHFIDKFYNHTLLQSLLTTYPEQKEYLFKQTVQNTERFSYFKTLRQIEILVNIFSEHHEEIFQKKLGEPKSFLKTIINTGTLKRAFQIFSNHPELNVETIDEAHKNIEERFKKKMEIVTAKKVYTNLLFLSKKGALPFPKDMIPLIASQTVNSDIIEAAEVEMAFKKHCRL